jgi:hypothetical protein
MRNLTLVAFVVAIAVSVVVAPVYAVTVTQWVASPITVKDKVFTLISTTWAGDTNVSVANFSGNLYSCSVAPVTDKTMTNVTKSLIYRVTIVDDPSTVGNEAALNWISSVSGDGNRFIVSGVFKVTATFDDNSDFSSPLATAINSGTPFGPSSIAGTVKDLYVRLTYAATGGSTLLTSHTVTFQQMANAVPVDASTWGKVKALYR